MKYLRKQSIWILALLLVAVLLTACPSGGDGNGNGNGNNNDNTPPTIGTLELKDAADSNVTVAKIIELQVTANDETGIAKLEFFQNGQKIGEDASAPYEQSVNLTKEDNGSLSFTAKAVDVGENESALSGAVAVNVNIQDATLVRESKSSAIAITGNDKLVVQVNPENDSISIFDAVTSAKLREVNNVGDEPVAVVIHPDDDTAFVIARADHKIVKITGLNGNPVKASEVLVGSEPTGLALSPTGKKLVVAEFGQSRISLIDTGTMSVLDTFDVPNPRAVAITNDNDTDDNDEKVVVTEFYGRLIADNKEAQDDTRTGAVRIFDLNDNTLAEASTVLFPPFDDIGNFQPGPNISQKVTKVTSPNQLYSVAIAGDKFFVVATAASPDGNASFNQNIRQTVLVGKISTGQKLGVINLSAEIKEEVPDAVQNFMADIVDLSLIGDDILYFASRGGDGFQRAVLTSDSSVTLGVEFKDGDKTVKAPQVDLFAEQKCTNPIGIVTAHDNSDTKRAFVNCWVSRTMVTVDLKLAPQKAIISTASANAPAAGLESQINLGRRFYFTGRARWSNEAWSSCGSCHPDGLSDNVTWRFGAGPRQTISMDSTFYGDNRDIQRVLNWSAEREEIHDFERNTFAVSGGLGAITQAITPGGECKKDPLGANEKKVSLNPAEPNGAAEDDINGVKVQLGIPVKEIQDTTAGICVKDWDDITEFSRTIRPVTGIDEINDGQLSASVSRGRGLFQDGGCATCHSGEGWTVSSTNIFLDPAKNNEPSSTRNAILAGINFGAVGTLIEPERTPDPATNPIAPAQLRCVLRNVGTFGVNNDLAATGVLELKAPNALEVQGRAQGEVSGFNVPSLFGLQTSAPYLHHGQANTLRDLLTSTAYNQHTLAGGNTTFTQVMDNDQNVTDLVNFLLSIDEDTQIFTIPAGADLCAGIVVPSN